MCCLKAGSCFALHPSGEICPEANLISWLQRVTLVTGREKRLRWKFGCKDARLHAWHRHESAVSGETAPNDAARAHWRVSRFCVTLLLLLAVVMAFLP